MLIVNTLTNKEHVKSMGGGCPVCENDDIQSVGSLEADAGTIWENMECQICGTRWTNYYALREYGLESPNSDSKDIKGVIKTFDSGAVSIVDVKGNKAVVVESRGKRSWFTKLDSPRIKRIKDKKVREEVKQALTEIRMVKALEPK